MKREESEEDFFFKIEKNPVLLILRLLAFAVVTERTPSTLYPFIEDNRIFEEMPCS